MSPATKLPTRKVGDADVDAMGFGAMNIAAAYGDVLSAEERMKLLDSVYELGCTHWDIADIYLDSEDILSSRGRARGMRSSSRVATKFGFDPEPGKIVSGKPAYVRKGHRKVVEQPRPSNDVDKASLRSSAKTLRRAHAVHPIAAVQNNYSPFTLDIEDEKIGLLKAARELDVAITVAYSPFGRGFLTGKYATDVRRPPGERLPADYSPENFPNIVKLCDGLALLAQGEDVIPIPRTTKIANLKDNLAALDIKLSPEDIEEVRRVAAKADTVKGERYPPYRMHLIFADTPELLE
ncbi:NADP-dependent oxidoreductase domain-containing protein [Daedaleopsis nitida]|nr:NADP-dependent oxidoreductase domain-containing protein [Daedaleopsis nitida]